MKNIDNYLSHVLGIPEEAMALCEAYYTVKLVKKGEFLLREGEICKNTYFVETGLLKMYSIGKNGKEHIIQFAPEKWLISDRSSLYFNENSNYYIEAIENCKIVFLDADFLKNLGSEFPEVTTINELMLQKHIRNLQNRINSLLAATAEERYLSFIKMYPDILQRVPQRMVASYLGITPESLSRVRKELVKK